MKNAWRTAHGLPRLPVPTPRPLLPVPEEEVRRLVGQLVGAPEPKRRGLEARAEALGLGALPGVLKLLGQAGQADRPVLERLARRLACTVTAAEVVADGLKPDAALVGRVRAMRGKPFDPDAFDGLARSLVEHPPAGAYGLRFHVDRPGDGTGLTLKVTLLDAATAREVGLGGSITRDADPPPGVPFSWGFHQRVEVGGSALLGGSGVCTHAHWLAEGHAAFREALRKACAAAPQAPIVGRLQLISDLAE